MGKKSVKENKNQYQIAREELELTRAEAAELLEFVGEDRIEKIENERVFPRPEEVLAMADKYKCPQLCNYYCSHECSIGQKFVPEVKLKELSQITLEMVAMINTLNKEKDRLIEITVDGEITADEKQDFSVILDKLSEMSSAIESLTLWAKSRSIEFEEAD